MPRPPRALVVALGLAATLAPRAARAEPCPLEPDPGAPPVPMKAFAERLRARVDACATEARRPDAKRFCAEHGLDCTEERVRDYTRLRTLFELTRDGGPFRLRWAVTDREPTARHVWKAWSTSPPEVQSGRASATAECDELSAVLAGLARRLGVRRVGLFWPTWNHTIAAWDAAPGVRVLLPTSQIFLGCDATFDRTAFSPATQRTVYEMSPGDVPDGFLLPHALATFLLDQVAHYGGASLEVLGLLRTDRAIRLGSSVPASCGDDARAAARALRARPLDAGDRRALERYGRTELGGVGADVALERLGR